MKKSILSIFLGLMVGALFTCACLFSFHLFVDNTSIKALSPIIISVQKTGIETPTQQHAKIKNDTPIEADLPPTDGTSEPARIIESTPQEHQEDTLQQTPPTETSSSSTIETHAEEKQNDTQTTIEKSVTNTEHSSENPKIVIIISDLGLSKQITTDALSMDPHFTLAFPTYADQLSLWIQKAHELKHETLLSIPMEPKTYPTDDPGPNALLLNLPDKENLRRLDYHLSKASGYTGIATHMGTGFLESEEKLAPVLSPLGKKRLLILETEKTSETILGSLALGNNLDYYAVDRFIDQSLSQKSIQTSLDSLVAMAIDRGFAIGFTRPYPIVLEELKIWIKTLDDKGVTLIPLSALKQ